MTETGNTGYGNPGGYGAYKQTQQQGEDYRVTEAKALLSCAALMEEAKSPDIGYLEFAEAVRHNQRLWTVFQAALVEDKNPLPAQLKDTLKGLSVYVDRRTLRALAEHKPELLNVLININKEIAGGLMDSYNKDIEAIRAKQQDAAQGSGDKAASDAPPMPRINTQIL